MPVAWGHVRVRQLATKADDRGGAAMTEVEGTRSEPAGAAVRRDAGQLPVAATVVLLRDGDGGPEVLLLERPRDRGSFAGAWVFPGGAVDRDDWLPGSDAADPEEDAARRAAVREVWEETGLVIPPDQLVTTALWMPPENVSKRMRTWFFTARAPDGNITLEPAESIDYAWIRPEDALERHGAGTLSLVPPTWVTLHGLRRAASVADILDLARAVDRSNYATRIGTGPSGPVLFWRGDVAYDDDSLIDAEGGRHRLEIGRLPWAYSRSADLFSD